MSEKSAKGFGINFAKSPTVMIFSIDNFDFKKSKWIL